MSSERINDEPAVKPIALQPAGHFPNNSLPVLVYKGVISLPRQKHKAAGIVQAIFSRNNWKNSWRNGIYDYHHYHSNTHEVLGICAGSVTVMLGGPEGKRARLEPGDVLIIPAGVAHRCIKASEDFLCVGAYPGGKEFDIMNGVDANMQEQEARISRVPMPERDPVYGKRGPLMEHWNL